MRLSAVIPILLASSVTLYSQGPTAKLVAGTNPCDFNGVGWAKLPNVDGDEVYVMSEDYSSSSNAKKSQDWLTKELRKRWASEFPPVYGDKFGSPGFLSKCEGYKIHISTRREGKTLTFTVFVTG